MEENDLRKIIKEMEEKKEEDLKEKLELLNKFLLLSSSLALIVGGLWFLLYSIIVVNDFPRTIDTSLFYYIFAMFIFFILLIVYPLAFYLYVEIEDDILDKKNKEEYGIGIKNKNFNSKDEAAENNNNLLNKIKELIGIKCKEIDNNKMQNNRYLKKIALFYLVISIFANVLLFFYVLCIKGYFFIFPINSVCKEGLICKVFIGLAAIIIFLRLNSALYCSLKDLLKRIIIYKDNNALFISIIFIPTLVIMIYAFFFLTAPFYILKLGYFKANLILEEKYVEKSGLKTYLENCQPKCLDESSNDNYCKFFITCSEKCQTECLDELFKDTQNNNHCRKFKFFIFLRTKSEYIVGCSENSNVRIHIPADKVIAIEYKD